MPSYDTVAQENRYANLRANPSNLGHPALQPLQRSSVLSCVSPISSLSHSGSSSSFSPVSPSSASSSPSASSSSSFSYLYSLSLLRFVASNASSDPFDVPVTLYHPVYDAFALSTTTDLPLSACDSTLARREAHQRRREDG